MESHLTLTHTRHSLFFKFALFVLFVAWTSSTLTIAVATFAHGWNQLFLSAANDSASTSASASYAAANNSAPLNITVVTADSSSDSLPAAVLQSTWQWLLWAVTPSVWVWDTALRCVLMYALYCVLLVDGDAFPSAPAPASAASESVAGSGGLMGWLRRHRHVLLAAIEDEPSSAHPQSVRNTCSRMHSRLHAVMCGVLLMSWSEWSRTALYVVCGVMSVLPLIVIEMERIVKQTDEVCATLHHSSIFFVLSLELRCNVRFLLDFFFYCAECIAARASIPAICE
jgi:hypothetical protein